MSFEGEGAGVGEIVCMQKGRDCWGEVAAYAFDIDLPIVTLCKGHIWALHEPASRYERARIAEEMEGLSDDA